MIMMKVGSIKDDYDEVSSLKDGYDKGGYDKGG